MKKAGPVFRNLGQLLRRAAETNGRRPFTEIRRGFRRDVFSFEGDYRLALRLAAHLRRAGLRKGDIVVLFSPNMPELVAAFHACWLAGLVAVPIDVRMSAEKIRGVLEMTRPKRILASKTAAAVFPAGAVPVDILEDLAETAPAAPAGFEAEVADVGRDDPAEIVLTSGTTGNPRGVILTHGNFLADTNSLRRTFPANRRMRILSLLPLSHAFEQMIELLMAFTAGPRVFYPDRYDLSSLMRAFRAYRVTGLIVVPRLLSVILQGIRRKAGERGRDKAFERALRLAGILPRPLRRLLFRDVHRAFGGRLDWFIVGGAPLDASVRRSWELLGVRVYEGYGATELTMTVSLNMSRKPRPGSVGRILPGIEARIDDNGEILVRGPTVSPGYFDDPAATAAAFRDGWFHTGDVGRFDNDGYLSIIGRTAFRIIRQDGTRVYPESVEKVLRTMPGVAEACVVGRRTADGEVVHAVLAGIPSERIADVVGGANRLLDEEEWIEEGSAWPDEDLPRNQTLKVDRGKVRDWIEGRGSGTEAVEKPSGRETDLLGILSEFCRRSRADISDDTRLGYDLGLDSLGRLEFLALLESRFGADLSGFSLTQGTTVRDLRGILRGGTASRETRLARWPHRRPAEAVRAFFLEALILPFHRLFVPLEIVSADRLDSLTGPCLFFFNHLGPYDVAACLRILPGRLRRRLVVLADRQGWTAAGGLYGFVLKLFFGCLPIADRGEAIRAGLDRSGALAAEGHSLVIAPEGAFSKDGALGEFKPGAGLLAAGLKLPVIPIHIDPGYQEVFPAIPFGSPFKYLPKTRRRVRVTVGPAFRMPEDLAPKEASDRMREEMIRLAASSSQDRVSRS